MPLTIPTLDDRKYQDLLDEALARIPVHNPEWTNFNKSDPGVTLIEVFAFLTETLLYRSNQIPERNRRKFLQLLGVPLQASASARGIVTFTNDRGPLRTLTLNDGLEVRAGSTPFRTEQGLDVLPIEAQVFYKRQLQNQSPQLVAYYNQLYASYKGQPPTNILKLYETAPFSPRGSEAVDLSQTVDNALWIALLVRAADVCLKERRKLVMVVRETPLHLGHLRTLTQLAEIGAILLPPIPGMYARPKTVDDIVNHTVGKALDQFGIENALF